MRARYCPAHLPKAQVLHDNASHCNGMQCTGVAVGKSSIFKNKWACDKQFIQNLFSFTVQWVWEVEECGLHTHPYINTEPQWYSSDLARHFNTIFLDYSLIPTALQRWHLIPLCPQSKSQSSASIAAVLWKKKYLILRCISPFIA